MCNNRAEAFEVVTHKKHFLIRGQVFFAQRIQNFKIALTGYAHSLSNYNCTKNAGSGIVAKN